MSEFPVDGFQMRMLAHLLRELQLYVDAATCGFSVIGPDGERVDPQDVIGTNAGPPTPALAVVANLPSSGSGRGTGG